MGGPCQLQRALGQLMEGLSQPLGCLRLPLGWTDERMVVQTYRFPLYFTGLRPPLGPKPKKERQREKIQRKNGGDHFKRKKEMIPKNSFYLQMSIITGSLLLILMLIII